MIVEDRDVGQAHAVIHTFTENARKLLADQPSVMASALHECLVDSIDMVKQADSRRGRVRTPDESFLPQAVMAQQQNSKYQQGVPIIDLKTTPFLWGILDTACNSSLIGYKWRKNEAEPVWKKHGYLDAHIRAPIAQRGFR